MQEKLSNYQVNVRTYKINYVLAFFFTPIAIWPLYYGRFISFSQVGIIYAIAFAIQKVLELPSGALADLIGRKYTIVLA